MGEEDQEIEKGEEDQEVEKGEGIRRVMMVRRVIRMRNVWMIRILKRDTKFRYLGV